MPADLFSLRRMRERLQLTQQEVGAAVQESPQVISNIERGVTELRVSLLEALAEHLSLPLPELIAQGLEAEPGGRNSATPRPSSTYIPEGEQLVLEESSSPRAQQPNLYYVPNQVQAGLDLTNLEQALTEQHLTPGYVPELPPNRRHFAFQVSGSSMEPVLYPGDYLIAQPLELAHVQREELCVVALQGQEVGPSIVVKYLTPSRSGQDYCLSSANPDYPEQFVYPYQIQAVFRYTALLTLHVESQVREWKRLNADNDFLRRTHERTERELQLLLDYVEDLKARSEAS